jgi:endonuclease YncB( thermonuclease family)
MNRLAATLLVLLAGLLLAPGAASARMGPCLPGQTAKLCHIWTGKVTAVNDGDTMDVNIDGDRTNRAYTVRVLGINTTEETVYTDVPQDRRGECMAVAATTQLDAMLWASHRRVRLAAQNPGSRASYRLLRAVAMKIGNRWVDLGQAQMERGLALWFGDQKEWAWNGPYSRIAAQAAAQHVGIWNDAACGAGPSAGAPLRVWVNWDSKTTGNDDLNREWIKVRNLDPYRTVSLRGWWVRSGGVRRYHFPADATIPPGGEITVYTTANGNSSFDRFFWGLKDNSFPNATENRRQIGDGAYLFDPHGNLRSYMLYPCRVQCGDPLQGKVSLSALPGLRNTVVVVRNISAEPVDLQGYQLSTRYRFYPFGPNSVIQPGETMRVSVAGSPSGDDRLFKHWGLNGQMLQVNGSEVSLKTFDEIVVGSYSW